MGLRIGFVGVGGIAQRHLGNASKRDDIEILGHADIIMSRAETAAEKYGGRAYNCCVDLYDNEKPDVVVICTPPTPTVTSRKKRPNGESISLSRSHAP